MSFPFFDFTKINHVQLGFFLGLIFFIVYFAYRKFWLQTDKFIVEDMIKSFASGFSLSFIFKVMIIGYNGTCEGIGDLGNGCLLVGGFALSLFALDAYNKSLNYKENP